MGNYKYYKQFKVLLSEPEKFLATQLLNFVGILIYYICSARYQAYGVIIITGLSQISLIIVSAILAFYDPGIIPKILPNYEESEFQKIPINKEYVSD